MGDRQKFEEVTTKIIKYKYKVRAKTSYQKQLEEDCKKTTLTMNPRDMIISNQKEVSLRDKIHNKFDKLDEDN